MTGPTPVIDLFAGPGGLSEGFSRFQNERGAKVFSVRLSVEKDPHAHRTLELRSFFRQFPDGEAPDEYYEYLRGRVTRDALFGEYPIAADAAKLEAWRATLGQTDPGAVRARVEAAVSQANTWVLIGGPPCQAYSLVGRSRMQSKRGNRERKGRPFDSDLRHLLYIQYLRVIAEHAPAVFVMENVRGLLSAKLNGQGMFQQILRDLESPGFAAAQHGFHTRHGGLRYVITSLHPVAGDNQLNIDPDNRRPTDFVVRAEDFGVPQARHRLILIGIRQDILPRNVHLPYFRRERRPPVTTAQAIGDLPRLRSRITPQRSDTIQRWCAAASSLGKYLDGVPESPWLTLETIQGIREIASRLGSGAPLDTGDEFVPAKVGPMSNSGWVYDSRLEGVCNHAGRAHMEGDLRRYMFAAAYARITGRSPVLQQFPHVLLPDHRSAHSGSAFADRFRVQRGDEPATTVTSHISKDGHYFIHYDPYQCRSLTVREAARLQTFPDNYFFEGPRTFQYVQVGNAVPPLLARHIASFVYEVLAQRSEAKSS
jgi:DNA (cytosine-5)-methyltransferase 1